VNQADTGTSTLGNVVRLADGHAVLDQVDRIDELLGRGDVESLVGLFTETCVVHHPEGTARGRDELRQLAARVRTLPDGVQRVQARKSVRDLPDGSLVVSSVSVMIERDRDWLQGIPFEVWRDTFTADAAGGWLVRERWVERADGAPELHGRAD
jgi:hypothetical protein